MAQRKSGDDMLQKTGAWDPEEDRLLALWQSKLGNRWAEVAKHIPGRSGQQCAQRWRHKVNPAIKRDKWAPEEDAKLLELVKLHGVGKWAEIARCLEGRTDQQCMGRWRRTLDPGVRKGTWTPEEDEQLVALYWQYGSCWSRISKALKGRNPQQCRHRWHYHLSGAHSDAAGSIAETDTQHDIASHSSRKRPLPASAASAQLGVAGMPRTRGALTRAASRDGASSSGLQGADDEEEEEDEWDEGLDDECGEREGQGEEGGHVLDACEGTQQPPPPMQRRRLRGPNGDGFSWPHVPAPLPTRNGVRRAAAAAAAAAATAAKHLPGVGRILASSASGMDDTSASGWPVQAEQQDDETEAAETLLRIGLQSSCA